MALAYSTVNVGATKSRTPMPRYLFRTWSSVSNGVNDPLLFKSMMQTARSPRVYKGLEYDLSEGHLKSQLLSAIYGQSANRNPFVFFTISLMSAIQHAIKKGKKSEKWPIGDCIQIICIDTRCAKTLVGEKPRFHRVQDLVDELHLKPASRRAPGGLDLSDAYVTSDPIVPGQRSFYVSFDVLEEKGLFDLYPEWVLNANLVNPGLEKPIRDLRTIWFRAEQDAPSVEVTLAAQLASAFKPACNVRSMKDNKYLPMHIFAWFLALKNPSIHGRYFLNWLDDHSPFFDCSSAPPAFGIGTLGNFGIKEVDKYTQLISVLHYRRIRADLVQREDSTIPAERIIHLQKRYRVHRFNVNAEDKKRKREAEEKREAMKRVRFEPYSMGGIMRDWLEDGLWHMR